MQNLISEPVSSLFGVVSLPGDKSISHRAVMLGSIANGVTVVNNFLLGADCLATLHALSCLGVKYTLHGTCLTLFGVGKFGLVESKTPLNLGNSGTSLRLLAGLLAGQKFNSILLGDDYLSRRPQQRIVSPLRLMGGVVTAVNDNYAPLHIAGSVLHGITYTLPIASAQVKSCILLAGLYANSATKIIEPLKTRDHTEIMLCNFGADLVVDGNLITLVPSELFGTTIYVPADLSSCAFFIVAACICATAEVKFLSVGINPTRTGCLKILTLMGAKIVLSNVINCNGETMADISVYHSKLHAVNIDASFVAKTIDEYPILFIAAACATGTSSFVGIKELRIKESDRITAMLQGLRTLGIKCEETIDSVKITGGSIDGGVVDSFADHRIAMAFLIAGIVAREPIMVKDCANIATSFPGFITFAKVLGLRIVC